MALTFVAGIGLSVQVICNAGLRKYVGNPVWAAALSFVVGLIVVTGYLVVSRAGMPNLSNTAAMPKWFWIGGALGAFYVLTAILVGPKLGSALMLSVVVSAQLITTLFLDHFGVGGMYQTPATPLRIVGVVVVILGVILVATQTSPPKTPQLENPPVTTTS